LFAIDFVFNSRLFLKYLELYFEKKKKKSVVSSFIILRKKINSSSIDTILDS